MEVSGKIIAVLPAQGGISKTGNEWKKQEFVLETHDQYPKKICFQLFGGDRIAQADIQKDKEYTISFDIESREYQGRWYTNINAWKVELLSNKEGTPFQPDERGEKNPFADTKPESVAPDVSASDDLPF